MAATVHSFFHELCTLHLQRRLVLLGRRECCSSPVNRTAFSYSFHGFRSCSADRPRSPKQTMTCHRCRFTAESVAVASNIPQHSLVVLSNLDMASSKFLHACNTFCSIDPVCFSYPSSPTNLAFATSSSPTPLHSASGIHPIYALSPKPPIQ